MADLDLDLDEWEDEARTVRGAWHGVDDGVAASRVIALVAEVRRLREEAEKVRTGDLLIDEAWDVDVHDEVSRLRAENAQLKAALRRDL